MGKSSDETGKPRDSARPDYPNLRHIRLFTAAIRLQSLSAAAETIHVSQPAASQAIAKLGRVFGAELLTRQGNGVSATPAGEILDRRARRALGYLSEAAHRIATKSRLAKGLVVDALERHATVAQLRAVSAFSETGSFAAAARAIGQAEPSLQRAARDLERIAGVPLFDGAYRSLHLTSDGEMLAARASLTLKEFDAAREELRAREGVFDGRLVIGALPMARTRIVPSAVVKVAERYPEARIIVTDGYYETLAHQLTIGRVDMIVGALRETGLPASLIEEPLFEDELSIVARAGHPLATATAPDLSDLSRYPWVLARQGTPNRAIFDRLASGFPPETETRGHIETGSLVALRGVLLQSDHLTLISPAQVEYELASGLLAEIAFKVPGTRRMIGVTSRSDWQPTALQRDFLASLRASVAQPLSALPPAQWRKASGRAGQKAR